MKNDLYAFRTQVLENLVFAPEQHKNMTLYRNLKRPESGFLFLYQRPGYYDLGIADYTIPEDFSLSFSHNYTLMKFGTFLEGKTEFQLDGKDVSHTTPSSFFVIEDTVKGVQHWKKGQHYHGIEITIYEPYFTDIISKQFPSAIKLSDFPKNYVYSYLPEEIIRILEKLTSLSQQQALSALYLESMILESLAILTNTIGLSPDNAFSYQLDYGKVSIGKDRLISLTPSDIKALQKAHDILTDEANNPPTIAELSETVLLNEQKLKAGFSHYYHTPIGAYSLSVRMTRAANMLITTDLSIHEIAKKTGYQHSGNFSREFKNFYGMSPLKYRRGKRGVLK
ncbi:AraC-like DNA-binding protein [Aequitasia blattaphilus]|uniref:AraC family transcriptional regulator n=1 Tax=Aequitasia blattaphilus TaxID=2949332 RepID=A0ABT1ECR7_9FIRM|nr:AraC family transcriptional regulator [Aequitasia blattaphilus]MCP1103615.1 AraC family transcriptional regulator [Aequitasia blattaphilus]MCR8616255.1 AraC family transcriptional regulator [Aequitasia blattaphilus]